MKQKPLCDAGLTWLLEHHELAQSDGLPYLITKGLQPEVLLFDRQLQAYLQAAFLKDEGRWLHSNSIADVLRVASELCRKAPHRPLNRRIAYADHVWSYDLAQDGNTKAVVIDGGEPRIVDEPKLTGQRTKLIRSMPNPDLSGDLTAWREGLHLPQYQFCSVLAATLTILSPFEAFNQSFYGPSGNGKSGRAKYVVAVTDSHSDGEQEVLLAPPKDTKDLVATAVNGYVLPYENLSKLPTDLSDAMCRLTDKGGISARLLYSNTALSYVCCRNPVIITSIKDVIRKQDLRSRTIIVEVPPIPADAIRGYSDVHAHLDEIRPATFGALLRCTAHALRHFPHTDTVPGIRLADAAKWVRAAAPVAETLADLPKGSLVESLVENRKESVNRLLEDDPVAAALVELAPQGRKWTAKDLRSAVGTTLTPTQFGCRLQALASDLPQLGVKLERDGRKWHLHV